MQAVYRLTESFPDREKFGLSHQFRRAAVSIPANVAEGFGKRSQAEKARFLNIAEGLLEECRYYLILTRDLGYGQTKPLNTTLEETSRLLKYLRPGRSGFWLLTSGFYIRKDIKGEALA